MTERSTSHPEQPALLSINDLAQLIGIAKRTVHTWRASGELPPPDLTLGKTVRWRATTINTWIDNR